MRTSKSKILPGVELVSINLNIFMFQEMNIEAIEENNKEYFVKRMITSGDMNVAIDATQLHLFSFQETMADGKSIDLAHISNHNTIPLCQIQEFAKDEESNLNFIIVSRSSSFQNVA